MRVDGPHPELVALGDEVPTDVLAVRPIGRAEEVRPLADDLLDEVGVVLDLVANPLGRERGELVVVHRVVAHDVTRRDDVPQDLPGARAQRLLAGLQAPAADEERGVDVGPGEHREQPVGGAGVGPVVEGEEHLARAGATEGEVPAPAEAGLGVEQRRGPRGRPRGVRREHHPQRFEVPGVVDGGDEPGKDRDAQRSAVEAGTRGRGERHERAGDDRRADRQEGRGAVCEGLRALSGVVAATTHRVAQGDRSIRSRPGAPPTGRITGRGCGSSRGRCGRRRGRRWCRAGRSR